MPMIKMARSVEQRRSLFWSQRVLSLLILARLDRISHQSTLNFLVARIFSFFPWVTRKVFHQNKQKTSRDKLNQRLLFQCTTKLQGQIFPLMTKKNSAPKLEIAQRKLSQNLRSN